MLAAGALVYAVGSIMMARPYVSKPLTLFVAVPVAAAAGLLVLGVLAFIVAVLLAALQNGDLDLPGLDFAAAAEKQSRVNQFQPAEAVQRPLPHIGIVGR